MQDYNPTYARVYDMSWGRFASELAPRVLSAYRRPPTTRVLRLLDVGCGTGQFAQHALTAGCEVVGFDRSEAMLQIAKQRNREWIDQRRASFLAAEHVPSELRDDPQFDICVATYSTLNHFTSSEDIGQCFDAVRSLLLPDGLFFFDVTTIRGLQNWTGVRVIETDQMTVINRGVFDTSMDRAYMATSGYVLNVEEGTYDRFSEVIFNLALPVDLLTKMLSQSGFRRIQVTPFVDFEKQSHDPEQESRIAILARP